MTKRILLGVVAVAIVVAMLWRFELLKWDFGSQPGMSPTANKHAMMKGTDCPGKTITVETTDTQMGHFLKPGEKFKVHLNWFACNPAKHGDLVYYRYHTDKEPIVRIIRGIPGDKFKLILNKEQHAWNVSINNTLLLHEKAPYFFGVESAPPMLSLYEKPNKGALPENTFIILSAVPPGTLDSGSLGVVNSADFVGKVELPRNPEIAGVSAPPATAPSPALQR